MWLTALRSGEYSQTKTRLQDSQGYCCLGVACEVLIPKDKRSRSDGYFNGAFPREEENSPEWLKDINHDFRLKTLDYTTSLGALNDHFDLTFKQIADHIEEV